MSSESPHTNQHIHPTLIDDVSTGVAGPVASEVVTELAGEQADLLQESRNDANYGSTSVSKAADYGGYALPRAQLLLIVAMLNFSAFLAALDGTVVTTLLTVIASDLHQVENIQWIATSYLLASAAFQPLFGKLSDIFGRKFFLVICGTCFTIGCAVCRTDSLGVLIAGRFITGFGGSGFTALSTITLSDLIPLRDRGMYQGISNISYGLGAASGGIIGGVISEIWGWKYVFICQVPFSALATLIIYFNLKLPEGSAGLGSNENMKAKLKRVDFLGSFFLVAGLMIFMICASMGGHSIPFASKEFVGLASLSFALFAAFLYVEAYVSEEPIIPVELLKTRTILASSMANWFYTMSTYTLIYYMPLFYASVLQLSSVQNGFRLIPNFMTMSFGTLISGLYIRKTGRYYNYGVVCSFLSVIGTVKFLFLTENTSTFTQYTVSVLPSIGYAAMLISTLIALLAAVPLKYQARTTAIQYTFRSTGSTLGVTVSSAIFQSLLKSNLYQRIHQIIPDYDLASSYINKALEDAQYVQKAPEVIKDAITQSYASGCRGAFGLAMVTVILGHIAMMLMQEHKLSTTMNREDTDEQ